MRALCGAAALTLTAVALAGCGVTTAVVYGTGSHYTTSSWEKVTPLGEPETDVHVEARFEDMPVAFCETTTTPPEESVTSYTAGVDAGGRMAIGAIGVGEALFGGIVGGLGIHEANQEGAPVDAGQMAFAAAMMIDGLAALIMAFTIPDHYHERQFARQPLPSTHHFCPEDLVFEYGDRVMQVDASGRISAYDQSWLMEQLVVRGGPVTLRFRESVIVGEPSPQDRCRWAVQLRHPAARSLCRSPRPLAGAP